MQCKSKKISKMQSIDGITRSLDTHTFEYIDCEFAADPFL